MVSPEGTGTGTNACADVCRGCDIAAGDVDVGLALGAIAAADAGTGRTRSIDGAAVDVDLRGVGRIAAAADGCTEAAGGCDVAVSDTDNGLEGVRITCRRTEDAPSLPMAAPLPPTAFTVLLRSIVMSALL